MTTAGVRLDIWLWRARFFKTRILSGRCIASGKVRIVRGGQIFRVRKPHSEVYKGDQLTFAAYDNLHQIVVLALGERRGSANEAQALYCHILSDTPSDL